MSFVILTDTSANLPSAWLRRERVEVIPFQFFVNGAPGVCTETAEFDGKAFYDAMRSGALVRTTLITPEHYAAKMRPILEAGEDLLFIGMSSGISGAYQSAEIAAAELREAYPARRLRCVDTLGASLGEGLAVLRAAELRRRGRSLDETAEELLRLRHRIVQVFTVDDLKYLRRGGRLSAMKAAVASVLNIKPLLKGDPEGRIVCFDRARGRRRSVEELAERYEALVEEPGQQTVGIAHADCPEDADYLSRLLRRTKPPKEILTVCYEPVTGSHVGPGALALFFTGGENVRMA